MNNIYGHFRLGAWLSAANRCLKSMPGLFILLASTAPLTFTYADEDTSAAQHNVGYSAKQWYLSGGETYYGEADESAASGGYGPALNIGYGITDKWAIEALYTRYELDNKTQIPIDEKLNLLSIDALYSFKKSTKMQPFVIFGAGVADEINVKTFEEFRDKQVNVGAGIFYRLTDRFSLRGDLRANYSFEFSQVRPFAFLGVSVKLGKLGRSKPTKQKAKDSDQDGVIDNKDQCPDTPAGSQVDTKGCVIKADDDNDGVLNVSDLCPSTPAGTQVDSKGCNEDKDGDGVANEQDNCPDTQSGAKVDLNGCQAVLKKEITTYLDVAFETDSSSITTLDQTEINEVIEYMREYPDLNAVVEGHTDSRGSAEYNLQLSQKRAVAVKKYLVDNAGIAAERLSAKGFGESIPVADNSTAEGRELNRRVSVVINAAK